MTLKEIYAKAKEAPKPEAPATAFVRELAELTKKSEIKDNQGERPEE